MKSSLKNGELYLPDERVLKYKGENFMQVSEIRIRKVEGEGKLKAYVTVTFDSVFVVHNVKIIEGKTGLFIAMPSRKTANGEYKDVAHPISPEFRNALQDQILAEYNAGHVEAGTVSSDGE